MPWLTGLVIKNSYNKPTAYIKAKVIQPNISLNEKRTNLNKSLLTLIDLSTRSSNDSIDVIIWPESSISSRFLINDNYNDKVSRDMNNFLKSGKIKLVAGLESNYTNQRFNSSVLFNTAVLLPK